MKMHSSLSLLSVLLMVVLGACSSSTPPAASSGSAKPNLLLAEQTSLPATTPTVIIPTSIPSTIIPTLTSSPTVQATPQKVAQATPNSGWVRQGPGDITCPILLYHRIEVPKVPGPYYVTPSEFRAQMQALKDWGYTPIPTTLLVKAITVGAKLPSRPIVLTFDDGDSTVYSQAFPIMKELGFTGVTYLVANYVGTEGYMTVEQLKELSAAGWEMGSHSMTHTDLTTSNHVEWEVVESRNRLEKLLGVRVPTFAFPFGMARPDMYNMILANYRAGLGLGVYLVQKPADLYYLWRRPIDLGVDLKTFGTYLPWSTPPGP